jgi:hypothetical protein
LEHVIKVYLQKILLKINNYKAKETRSQGHSLEANPHEQTLKSSSKYYGDSMQFSTWQQRIIEGSPLSLSLSPLPRKKSKFYVCLTSGYSLIKFSESFEDCDIDLLFDYSFYFGVVTSLCYLI